MFRKKVVLIRFLLSVFLVLFFSPVSIAHAAPIVNFPVTISQPDGTKITLYLSGDEYYNWASDAQGFTVMRDPANGFIVYAGISNDVLYPTSLRVGSSNPASAKLLPYTNISPAKQAAIRQTTVQTQTSRTAAGPSNASQTGTINNLVVFIRFSDEAEFTTTTSTYADMFNSAATGANSLLNYFKEVSYNQLTINSTLYPTPGTTIVSYQDTHPRGYFQSYDATTNPGGYNNGTEVRLREHALLQDAVAAINALGQFPAGSVIDGDNDGYVDSITFVVNGKPDLWADLLWPHQWSLYSYNVSINTKRVYDYSFHLSSSFSTSVLAHEMFHVLGAPDLYHYTNNGINPVGTWDLMEYNSDPPEHMGCYMKYKYGHWISSLPELSATGTYTISPLSSATNNCFKIASPFSATEFFVLEYRKKVGPFESSLPGSGLLVYRINTAATGNASGPPDEVYLYRPGGSPSANGDYSIANFNSYVGRKSINDTTNPYSFLAGGGPGGLNICNIGPIGTTISFDICASSSVTITGSTGQPGTTYSYLQNGQVKTAASSSSGTYSIVVPNGWSGSLYPYKPGFIFTPPSRAYASLASNQTGQDYSAASTNLLLYPGFDSFSPNWSLVGTGSLWCGGCGVNALWYGPRTGSNWVILGNNSGTEHASLSQSVTIPSGQAVLEFYLWTTSNSGVDQNDTFSATIDGAPVFTTSAADKKLYSSYTQVSVDVSAYANGLSHLISFKADTTGQIVFFNLDDVALYTFQGYSITGNAGAAAVTLNYADTDLKSVTAAGDGSYTMNITSGWSGPVVPSLTGYTFSPSNRLYESVVANQVNQNYTAIPPTPTVTPTLTVTPILPTSTAISTSTMTVTLTSVPPTVINTATITSTLTPVPPTVTNTATVTSTVTPVPPTVTNTATITSTLTPVPPTITNTATITSTMTSVPPIVTNTATVTSTLTPVPPTIANTATITSTMTSVPPIVTNTATVASTLTPVPPTIANTATVTSTLTSVPPTIPNTATVTSTATPVPPTVAHTATVTATMSSTATSTSVPPSNTPTATATITATVTATAVPLPAAFNKSLPTSGKITRSSVTLSWAVSTRATSYEYCYDTSNDNACSTWISIGTATSQTLTGLTNAVTYYWQVRAKNAGGYTYANAAATNFWPFTVDAVAPRVASIALADPNPSTASSVRFTVNFSEVVTGVDLSDFNVTVSGITGTISGSVNGTGLVRTVTITTGTGIGTIRLDVVNNGTILDLAGNPLSAAFSTGPKYTMDRNNQFNSTASTDGWVLETTETSNLGGTRNTTGTLLVGDDVLNKEYRSILDFNTSALPDNAVITKVTLKLLKSTITGTSPFLTHGNLLADIRKGYLGASAALESADFQAVATKNGLSGFTALTGGWYQLLLSPINYVNINKLGSTQFRLHFTLDDNNNKRADNVAFFAGDSSTVANRPILIVEYTLP